MKKFLNDTLGKVITGVDWLNVPAGTYVRYILAIVAALNTLLNVFGCNPINVNGEQLYDVVSSVMFIAILFVNTYYDNPTSKEGIASNKYFKMLKSGDIALDSEDKSDNDK